MDAIKAEIGKKYLSKKGTPVTVIKHKGDKVVVKIAGSDNEIEVAKSYELKPYEQSKISPDTKALIRANGKNGKGNHKRENTLAGLIDPMLFSGGKTVKEIAEVVVKEAADLAKGKDMEANVRARMVTYSRKGWKIVKNDQKHVKVFNAKS